MAHDLTETANCKACGATFRIPVVGQCPICESRYLAPTAQTSTPKPRAPPKADLTDIWWSFQRHLIRLDPTVSFVTALPTDPRVLCMLRSICAVVDEDRTSRTAPQ